MFGRDKTESTRIDLNETVQQIMLVIIVILSVFLLIIYFSSKKNSSDIVKYQKTATDAVSENNKLTSEITELNKQIEELTAEIDTANRTKDSYSRNYYDGSFIEHTFTVKSGALKADKLPMNFSASSYKDDRFVSQLGIDVSKHQGKIDWERVAATKATADQGYQFAIIRAAFRGYSNGELGEDDTFAANIHGAYDNGLDVGVYVYSQAINEEEAEEEAALVLELLEREGFSPKTLKYGIAFDYEKVVGSEEARTNELTPEQWTNNAIAFLSKVREAGYETMLYSNLEFEAENFDISQLEEYNIWYAEYKDFPTTPYAYKLWQFTESGIVEGISEKVDINLEFVPR